MSYKPLPVSARRHYCANSGSFPETGEVPEGLVPVDPLRVELGDELVVWHAYNGTWPEYQGMGEYQGEGIVTRVRRNATLDESLHETKTYPGKIEYFEITGKNGLIFGRNYYRKVPAHTHDWDESGSRMCYRSAVCRVCGSTFTCDSSD